MTFTNRSIGNGFDTGLRGRHVVDIVETRPAHIPNQVAANQVAAGGQDADGTLGVPGQMQDFSRASILGEILTILEIDIRFEWFEHAWPGGEKSYEPEEEGNFIGFGFSVPAHVAALDHARIAGVQGDFRAVLFAEISAIAGVVRISMRQDDELKIARLAARLLKFLL